MFHISGRVNRHNCRIWGTENPHEPVELGSDSPKVNVWCGLGKKKNNNNKSLDHSFCKVSVINEANYFDMPQNYLFLKLNKVD